MFAWEVKHPRSPTSGETTTGTTAETTTCLGSAGDATLDRLKMPGDGGDKECIKSWLIHGCFMVDSWLIHQLWFKKNTCLLVNQSFMENQHF